VPTAVVAVAGAGVNCRFQQAAVGESSFAAVLDESTAVPGLVVAAGSTAEQKAEGQVVCSAVAGAEKVAGVVVQHQRCTALRLAAAMVLLHTAGASFHSLAPSDSQTSLHHQRFFRLAAQENTARGFDPCWTRGLLAGKSQSHYHYHQSALLPATWYQFPDSAMKRGSRMRQAAEEVALWWLEGVVEQRRIPLPQTIEDFDVLLVAAGSPKAAAAEAVAMSCQRRTAEALARTHALGDTEAGPGCSAAPAQKDEASG
jgi:hypothetical protein